MTPVDTIWQGRFVDHPLVIAYFSSDRVRRIVQRANRIPDAVRRNRILSRIARSCA